MPSLLQVDQLRYAYGERIAVRDVSFEISQGEIFGLLGPNGAGKTTTISCISGHLRDMAGQLRMRGNEFLPSKIPAHRANLGLVPQELAIYETLTARENLVLFAKLAGVKADQVEATVQEFLAFAGLESRQNDAVSQFSGGMKRRLNLVAGLVHRPPLVLMDEPTVGVDPQSRNHLFESIEKIRASGASILYTTHYMEEAERLCDRIAIMNDGQIIAAGTPAELKASLGVSGATLEMVFLHLTGRSLRDAA